jgi:hypothetical protein
MIQKTGFFKLAIVLSVWLISGAQLLSEQLIVFTRGKAPSEVNAHFRAETLLPLKKWSRELGMEFVEVDVEKQGAPELALFIKTTLGARCFRVDIWIAIGSSISFGVPAIIRRKNLNCQKRIFWLKRWVG